MTDATSQEILEWALVNRARLDPNGELIRANVQGGINEGPVRDFDGNLLTLTTASKQALAWNDALGSVADKHNADMIAANRAAQGGLFHDAQSVHEAAMTNAGYNFRGWGENVSESLPFAGGDQAKEMHAQENSLFNDANTAGRGHRVNLMDDTFQEIGIGQTIGNLGGANRSIITEDFGRPSAGGQFLTGIAYNDADHDAFYSVGEGRTGIAVTVTGGATTNTATAGNYSEAIAAGVQTVTFSDGNHAKDVSVTIDVAAGRNALVDLVDQSTLETSVSLTAGSNVSKIIGLGNNGITLTGNAADNVIVSALGNDTLNGGAGTDTAVFAGKTADYTVVKNADGTTTVSGHGQTDKLISIEKLQFDDTPANPIPPPPIAGSVSIGDVTITEGSNGSHTETFTVKRTGGDAAFDVKFATKDGSATMADGDYKENHNTLHFAQGVNEQKISIVVNGDTRVEAPESFTVNLSDATDGATISKAAGFGNIGNDDVAPTPPPPVAGSISIGDKTITEGSNGSHIETFTVTRAGGSAAFDVHYATAVGSTSGAAGDYVAKGGDLHFAAGVNEQKISIVIDGDTKVEGNETFKINLSDPTKGATIADGQAIITITDDDVAATSHAKNDFTGDDVSDALFMNSKGNVALWELNGNHIDSNTSVGSVPAGWHVEGIADFGNDGKSDILLRHDNGKVAMWQMDGDHIDSNTSVGSVGSDWKVIATEDFNGDGKADVLWQNSAGKVAMWQMDGDHVASNTSVGSIGTDWKVIGADDFNGDGKADVLWQNSAGKVAMWQMDGDHVASNTSVGSIGSTWHAAGTGDFDADGKADILWQNDNGKVAMWQMSGDHIDSNTSVGSAAGWKVVDTGDYNHDGHADVLFENAAGKVAQWQMDGDHIEQNLSVGSHSTDWHHV